MLYRRPLSPPSLCRIPTVLSSSSIGSAQKSPLCCTPPLSSVFIRQNISFSLLFPHTDPPGLQCLLCSPCPACCACFKPMSPVKSPQESPPWQLGGLASTWPALGKSTASMERERLWFQRLCFFPSNKAADIFSSKEA